MPHRHSLDLASRSRKLPDGPPTVARATWIGAATVLVEVAGFTVLTDPAFAHAGELVDLGWGLSTRRLVEPSHQLADLPRPDLVLLSHLHGDHFDHIAQRDLPRDVPVVTTQHAAERLERAGFTAVIGLQTWDEVDVRREGRILRITSVPARHGPRVVNRLLPPVMGSVVDVIERHARLLRLYISGDTLMHEGLSDIRLRFRDIDVGLVHLGGTRVAGVLVTADDRHGVQIVGMLRPGVVLPVHHGDFDVFRSPVEDFLERSRASRLGERVVLLERGGTYEHHLHRTASVEQIRPAPRRPGR